MKAEFDRISEVCGGCLEVLFQRTVIPGGVNERVPVDTEVVNVLAVIRGTTDPNRYVLMTGDIDSRVSDILNATDDSPGANDNASGLAGVLEAARVLSQHRFNGTVVLAGLSGEEVGLFGGQYMAQVARERDWGIQAVLNNDMIGNIEGVDGVIDNTTFRIFSEPTSALETDEARQARRLTGGEVDGPSRQLARYVARVASRYVEQVQPMLVYRLDRFRRGGHHRPFNDQGFPAVRIMEAHENYIRQHQDVRIENGVQFGDLIDGVDFAYAAKLTRVNVATLASLGWAPAEPENVGIEGAVQPSTTLVWEPVAAPNLAGYKVYWRDSSAPQWQNSRFVGNVTEFTLDNIVIDNYFFGVAAVSTDGNESPVSLPTRVVQGP